MHDIVSEVFLDDVALIAEANDEVIDAVRRVDLENVPEDRSAADFNHGLRPDRCFVAQSAAQPASQDDRLHCSPPRASSAARAGSVMVFLSGDSGWRSRRSRSGDFWRPNEKCLCPRKLSATVTTAMMAAAI